MTELLFRDDAYLQDASGVITGFTEEGAIILDRTVFYPAGGGQPGDSGHVSWSGGGTEIATALKAGSDVALVPAVASPLPPVGTVVHQTLDWKRRHRHMRIHTALHLLTVAVGLPVTGGQIGLDKGRLDFATEDAMIDKEAVQTLINEMIERDLRVTEDWITDEELLANPAIVKTMSVMPPTGQGHVRLIRIGEGGGQIDLQPCGGTHVARTSEIGAVRVGKLEKKSRQSRRIYLHLE